LLRYLILEYRGNIRNPCGGATAFGPGSAGGTNPAAPARAGSGNEGLCVNDHVRPLFARRAHLGEGRQGHNRPGWGLAGKRLEATRHVAHRLRSGNPAIVIRRFAERVSAVRPMVDRRLCDPDFRSGVP
jgi:hypothetical protein